MIGREIPKTDSMGKEPYCEAGKPDTEQVTTKTQFSVALSSGLLSLPMCLDKVLPISWANPETTEEPVDTPVPTGIQTPALCPESTSSPPLTAFPRTCKIFT